MVEKIILTKTKMKTMMILPSTHLMLKLLAARQDTKLFELIEVLARYYIEHNGLDEHFAHIYDDYEKWSMKNEAE